jgi:hypothetical protein
MLVFMMGEMYLLISRKNTSVPPPGLECVTKVTRLTGYAAALFAEVDWAITGPIAEQAKQRTKAVFKRKIFFIGDSMD